MTQFSKGNLRSAKLSNEQVLEMRQLYHDEQWTQAALARRYGVNVNTVGRIVRGESRQRVPMPVGNPADIAARLVAIQEETNQATADKLQRDIQREFDSHVKPERELDAFKDPKALNKYGVDE